MLGKFICLEGNGGVGKSTLTSELVHRYNELDRPAVAWSFPNEWTSAVGLLLRQYLRKEIMLSPRAIAPLFLAEMADRMPALKARLQSGTTVFCDRYFYSTSVYQADNYMLAEIADMVRILGLAVPSSVVLLDLPVYIVEERLRKRGTDNDRYDEASRQQLQHYKDRYLLATRAPNMAPEQLIHITEPWTRSGMVEYVMQQLQEG